MDNEAIQRKKKESSMCGKNGNIEAESETDMKKRLTKDQKAKDVLSSWQQALPL